MAAPYVSRPRLRDPRTLLLLLLAASWLVMLWLIWRQFWTLPSPELLEQERMVRPPTLEGLALQVARAVAELGVLVVLLWPGRWYGARMATALVALVFYFLFTTPLGITSVQQVQRRWLAGVAVLLLLGLVLLLVRGAVRQIGRRVMR